MNPRIWAKVKLKVTIEIYAPGNYGSEWKVCDMLEQGGREGIQRLEKILGDEARIVGAPEMLAVTGYTKEQPNGQG